MTKDTLQNTGERMIPAFSKGGLEYGEHIVRYAGAVPLVKGKVVLDIASGSGYGTAMLAVEAKKVYGVDYDTEAINYAKKTFSKPNTTFIRGSATAIPFSESTFDVIVSFETLEHIEDYQKFIQEIKRVLKDDGLFILSTPNDKEFPEGAHFHIHEFERKELESLLKKYFKYTKPYFQATWKYNALIEERDLNGEFTATIPTINVAPVTTDKALYFYILCANRPINEDISPISAISEHWSTRSMLEHNAEMDTYIKNTIKHYEQILELKDQELADLRTNLHELQVKSTKRAPRWLKPRAKQ